MQDTPSNPQEGTGNLSQSDAVNLLLDTNSPSEEVSEVQPTTEVETEEVEAVEEQPTEAEAEETIFLQAAWHHLVDPPLNVETQMHAVEKF